MKPEKMISVKEVASTLGRNRYFIYREIHQGRLRAQKVGGSFYITPDAYREYLGLDREPTFESVLTDIYAVCPNLDEYQRSQLAAAIFDSYQMQQEQ